LVHGSNFDVFGLCGCDRNQLDWSSVRHKHNAARRHRISKMKFKLSNWREYETGLRDRGSLTLWLAPEALAVGLYHGARQEAASRVTLISPSRRP
jgi:hypothetical protein